MWYAVYLGLNSSRFLLLVIARNAMLFLPYAMLQFLRSVVRKVTTSCLHTCAGHLLYRFH